MGQTQLHHEGLKSYKIDQDFKQNSQIVVHEGDTCEFLKKVPDKSFKLIITSPPYNIGKVYEKKTDLMNYLKVQESIIQELIRTLRDDGSICWQVGNYVQNGEVYPLDIYYYDIFRDAGLKLRNRIVWRFGHGLHAQKRFSGRYEIILWFTKSDNYTFNLDSVRVPSKYPGKRNWKGKNKGELSGNPLGKNPSDFWETTKSDWETAIWDIPNVKSNHPEKTEHPCQFPIELVERCVLALTNEDDWVYDPFAGVGSALLAGLLHNRRVAGSEKEAEYVKLTRERIDQLFSGALKRRPLGKPVYQPTGKEKISQIPTEWKKEKQDESLRSILVQ
ncbi:site-specific DNA-methyltransferase [Candidatus Woesearchaeota archaeon]|nr:site-specific DNA-methyltransferase [Candidatus Woesearchaeota archaeon]